MSKKVLVIDNDFFFVEFLTELFETRGYEVVKSYDGKEGISKLEAGTFDFVFCDLIMPKIDGKQFIGFVRKKYPEADFPIIIMSATLVEQMDEMGDIGADYYLIKAPMEIMTEHVNTLLDRMEKKPFPDEEDNVLVEPGKLYPRQVTGELIENAKFQRAIVESIGVGIVVTDKDARIFLANSIALEIIGKSPETLLNQPITSLFPSKDREKLIKILKEIVNNRILKKLVFITTLNDQEIQVIVSALRVNGKAAGWIIAMEDSDQWAEQV